MRGDRRFRGPLPTLVSKPDFRERRHAQDTRRHRKWNLLRDGFPVPLPTRARREWRGLKTTEALDNKRGHSMSLSGDTAATLAWTDFQGTVPANPTRKAFTSTTFDVQTPFIFRVDGKSKK